MARRERQGRTAPLSAHFAWVLLLALSTCAWGAGGQTAQPTIEEQFLPDNVRAASAAAAVIGTGHPLAAAGVLIRGQDISSWTVEPAVPFAPSKPRGGTLVLDPEMLANVDDRKPLADINVNPDEVRAYYYTLSMAHKTPAEALFRSARRDLSYIQIFEETEVHRGQLIYVEGDLKRLWRFEPSERLKKEGVKDHYEGWIFDRRYEGQLARHCLIFTELPPEIKPGEDVDYPVKFAGYLFKRYRVRGPKSSFDAPLLIGRTLQLDRSPRPQGQTGDVKQTFLAGFFLVGGVTLAVMIALGVWYRRNDREVRRRLEGVRSVEFVEPEGPESPNGHTKG